MPGYAKPGEDWLGNHLVANAADLRGLKAQQTEYISDSEGNCRAIIGNLEHGPNGEATGLTGFGIAVKSDGNWIRVPAEDTVARGYRSTAFTLKAATLERVPLNAVSFDPGSNFELTHGYYVAPSSGYYSVAGNVSFGSAASAITRIASLAVNGEERSRPTRTFEAGEADLALADILKLAAGDHLELWAYTSEALGLQVTQTVNYLSVVRVA